MHCCKPSRVAKSSGLAGSDLSATSDLVDVLGYQGFSTGGCKKKNELGKIPGLSPAECGKKCSETNGCISFEVRKDGTGNCQLSQSCTYDSTVKKESSNWNFYAKKKVLPHEFTVTLKTNNGEFAGTGNWNNLLLAQFQLNDGTWSAEQLFSHQDIQPGEVVTQMFTTLGCPIAIRLINRSEDGYIFDTVSLEEEGHEPLFVAQRPLVDPSPGWGVLVSKARTDWPNVQEFLEFPLDGLKDCMAEQTIYKKKEVAAIEDKKKWWQLAKKCKKNKKCTTVVAVGAAIVAGLGVAVINNNNKKDDTPPPTTPAAITPAASPQPQPPAGDPAAHYHFEFECDACTPGFQCEANHCNIKNCSGDNCLFTVEQLKVAATQPEQRPAATRQKYKEELQKYHKGWCEPTAQKQQAGNFCANFSNIKGMKKNP